MPDMSVLRELNMFSIVVRIILSLIIGGVIGLERGSKNQPAGFRTYILVCLGASIVMMTNQYMIGFFGTGDPSRMGAQVISGIGFLGAGTIIVTRQNQVHGLTTAAGLWSSACLGLAVGIGFYECALIVSIVILFIMTVLHKLEEVIKEKSSYLKLYVNFDSVNGMNQFVNFCNMNDMKVIDMQISKMQAQEEHEVVGLFWLRMKKNQAHTKVIQDLIAVEGVKFIEAI